MTQPASPSALRSVGAIMDDKVPLVFMGLVFFFMLGIGLLIVSDNAASHERFQQCIAAGMQWHRGDCLK